MQSKRQPLDPNVRKTLLGFGLVIVCIMVFAYVAFSQPLDANHPELKWKTMETENFIIHYHDSSRRTASVIAKIAEEVHPHITGLYNYKPDTKFHFIVKDTDDYANGAAYYYNNKMLIWCTPLDYELRGTHNWLRDVITHEYTHIIQLGASRKITRKIPQIYFQMLDYEEEKRPDVLYGYPNVLASYPIAMTVVPMWFAEGTAQFNSPDAPYDFWDSHRDMQLRTRALNNELLPMNEMEVFGKNSLGNESVYNHGFGLVHYISDTYGPDMLRKITRESAKIGRWDMNKAIERATGIPGEELYENWRSTLHNRYEHDTETIRANLAAGETIEPNGDANLYSLWSPDENTLYYVSNQDNDFFSVRHVYARDNGGHGAPRVLIKNVSSAFDISPDGKWIAYSKIVRQRNESNYSDLFLYDIEKKKSHRLTRMARATEPAFSPDGSELAFVVNRDGTKDIAAMALPDVSKWSKIKIIDAKNIHKLTDYNDGRRCYRPRYNAEGTELVFAISRHFGRDIVTLNLETSEETAIVTGGGDQRDPMWSADGRWIYFADDKTGIFNLYRINANTGKVEALTNVTGGAFQPAVRNDGSVVFSNWTLTGYKLNELSSPATIAPEAMVYGRQYVKEIPEKSYDDSEPKELASKPYRPIFEQLFIVPRIAYDVNSFKPGFYFFSSDFLDKINFFGGIDLNKRGEFDAVAMMEFKALRPTIFAEGYYVVRKDDERFDDRFLIVNERRDADGNLQPVFDTYGVDYTFQLMVFDLGARFRLTETLDAELRASISRYDAYQDFDDNTNFHYTYFKGKFYQMRLHYDGLVATAKGNVHPRKGVEAKVTVAYEDNDFIDGFEVNQEKYTLQEVYSRYNYWRMEGDLTGWWNPVGDLVFQPRFRGGYLNKQVDPFMNLYAGGLHGMRGYSFYSLGGTRKLIGSLALRHPIYEAKRQKIGWMHFDGLYAGVFGDIGDAWRERDFDTNELKKDIGLELRAKFYSWYGFPTAITFAAARGLDTVTVTENDKTTVYDPEWRYYVTVLFDFETIFPARGTVRR